MLCMWLRWKTQKQKQKKKCVIYSLMDYVRLCLLWDVDAVTMLLLFWFLNDWNCYSWPSTTIEQLRSTPINNQHQQQQKLIMIKRLHQTPIGKCTKTIEFCMNVHLCLCIKIPWLSLCIRSAQQYYITYGRRWPIVSMHVWCGSGIIA